MTKIRKAIISLSDKSNLKSLLKCLKKHKIEIISSGGTFKSIKKLKYSCTEISEYTNFQEILDGRVKTLHPKIHAGILNKRNNKKHFKELKKNKFENIDLVVVNFYPFEKTLKNTPSHREIIEKIDIGGPSLVRAAAKNYNDVTVIVSPHQYNELIDELDKTKGSTSESFRLKMAKSAFTETAYYESLISNYFNKFTNDEFPIKKTFGANLIDKLRYGENRHQKGALYSFSDSLDFEKIHGKKLSFNNLNDIFSALEISKFFPKNTGVVIIKHANPCGVSIKKDKIKCYKSALACDPVSAFGGIIHCNFKINSQIALELNKIFLEVIIANGFEKNALKILKKKKNIRLIDSKNFSFSDALKINSINDKVLIQNDDNFNFKFENFRIVSKIKPTKEQMKNLIFAFYICKHVKSNAIVLAHEQATVGIGSGQPSRFDSCEIAIKKMKKFVNPSDNIVAASDAFFPFIDGVEKLIQSGISAIIQPSGSIRDKEIIKFANDTKTVLVFSKKRHFKH